MGMYHKLLSQSLSCGWTCGLFPVLPITNKTAMNIHDQVSVWSQDSFLWDKCLGGEWWGHMVSVCFVFEKAANYVPEWSKPSRPHRPWRRGPQEGGDVRPAHLPRSVCPSPPSPRTFRLWHRQSLGCPVGGADRRRVWRRYRPPPRGEQHAPLQVRLPPGAEGCLPKGPRLPGPRAPGECHGAGQGPAGAAVARDKGFWEEEVLRVRPGCLPSRCRGERAGKGPVPLGSEREGDRSHRSPGGRGETDGAGTGEGKQPNRGGANSLRPPGRWDGGGEGATGAQGFVTNESPEPGRRSLPPAGAPGPAPAAAARGRPHASSKPARPTSPAGCYSN